MHKSPWEDDDNTRDDSSVFYKKRKKPFFDGQEMPKFPKFEPKMILYILLGILALWLSTGLYKVKEGEQAAILRFGKFVRVASPGLNYHLPSPIEIALIEPVNRSRRIEIGYRSNNFGGNSSQYLTQESIMLTGDENIIDLNCDVMWHINDLEKFLFNVASPSDAVKFAAESAIREVIGETPISSVLSNEKQQIAEKIEKLLQATLNSYNAGIEIEMVNLLKAEPPVEVIDSYRDVQTSRADKEREINQAIAYNNDVLPKARGESAKILQAAEGYKQERIAKAKGDSERFLAIYNQYSRNKNLTKDRLYLEAVEEILKNNDKFIVGTGAFPHFAIDKLKGVK
jgi:modulator of FtsH protease HflK